MKWGFSRKVWTKDWHLEKTSKTDGTHTTLPPNYRPQAHTTKRRREKAASRRTRDEEETCRLFISDIYETVR